MILSDFRREWESAVLPALRTRRGGILALLPEPLRERALGLGGSAAQVLARAALLATLSSLRDRSSRFPHDKFVCLLLGRRTTHSSIDAVPPFVAADLVRAALSPRPAAKGGPAQTDLARAVTKHCIRCSSGHWGEHRGRAAEMNRRALSLLLALLREAVWVNWYRLPHEVCTYEIRDAQGYGMRWSFSPSAGPGEASLRFRGLLEPPMPDGHARGWVH